MQAYITIFIFALALYKLLLLPFRQRQRSGVSCDRVPDVFYEKELFRQTEFLDLSDDICWFHKKHLLADYSNHNISASMHFSK